MQETKRSTDKKSHVRSWLNFLREKRRKLEEATKKEHGEFQLQTNDGVLEGTI